MFLNRVQIFIISIILHILVPVVLFTGMVLWGTSSLTDALSVGFLAGNSIFLLFRVGYWEFSWYYLRYIIKFLFAAFGLFTLIYVLVVNRTIYSIKIYIDVVLICLAFIIMYINLRALCASIKPKEYMKLSFPFKGGKYIITDGGDGKISSLVNYHNKSQVHKKGRSNTSMRFAADIAKLNKNGFTVKNILKDSNSEYEIFHEKVYSPCGGVVVAKVDGIDNNIPFSRNFPYNVGNNIVVKNENYYIVMGHLEKGSILVEKGETVKTGQLIGIIGNSGLTPRPHLHIQVSKCDDGFYWSGEGVPVIFDDDFYPVKNKVITVQ